MPTFDNWTDYFFKVRWILSIRSPVPTEEVVRCTAWVRIAVEAKMAKECRLKLKY